VFSGQKKGRPFTERPLVALSLNPPPRAGQAETRQTWQIREGAKTGFTSPESRAIIRAWQARGRLAKGEYEMKKVMIAALLAAQLAVPAQAADLVDTRASEGMRPGGFAGARIRISLDAEPRERVRAGVTIAPTRHDMRGDGSARLRFGEGLEFGFSERRSASFSFAGEPVRDLVSPVGPDGKRSNVSTVGWVAIGVGVAAVTVFSLYALCGGGQICSTDDE
jgi:hypothetical protein